MMPEGEMDRIVRSWLEDGVTTLSDRILDDVLNDLPRTKQHRPLWSARRVARRSLDRIVLPLVALSFFLLATTMLLQALASSDPGPAANPATLPTEQLTEPPGESAPLPGMPDVELLPGTYTASAIHPTAIQVTVPDGWRTYQDSLGFTAIVKGKVNDAPEPDDFRAVAFWTVRDLYADPCKQARREPPVGPTVDDLVAAFGDIPSTITTSPTPTMLGGYPATHLQLILDRSLPCDPFYLWPDRFAQGPGERDDLWILDVGGARLIVSAEWLPGVSDSDLIELRGIVESIVIVPAEN